METGFFIWAVMTFLSAFVFLISNGAQLSGWMARVLIHISKDWGWRPKFTDSPSLSLPLPLPLSHLVPYLLPKLSWTEQSKAVRVGSVSETDVDSKSPSLTAADLIQHTKAALSGLHQTLESRVWRSGWKGCGGGVWISQCAFIRCVMSRASLIKV